ncbi:MAG: hypothetical protein WBP64_12135 [Nitrososphaeraceae archaeon]
MSAANSLMMVQKVPAAWLVQIKAAGQWLMYQNPERSSRFVKTILESS